MIGSISKGSDFGGCVGYALAVDKKDKEARLLYAEGVLDDSPQSIVAGFECQRHLNHRVEKWVGHISLSYSPEDSARLTDDAMVKLAKEYMEKMGIVNTQYIIARHLDKEHPHCHIVYNRVNYDGKCIDDGFERYRNADICRELKRKYGLTFGEGKDKVKTERLRGRDKTRQEIYLALRDALKVAKDWTSFQRELAKSGVTVRKKFRRNTTIVEGLSFVKDSRKFKASDIDKKRRFSYANICRILDENKNGKKATVPPTPKISTAPISKAPSLAENVIDTAVNIADNLSAGIGGFFQVGSAYDPEEEAFIRQMNRRKKKKGRKI
ncbi:relaxase/mobilization nuclease domain protein [Parabacteroides distasonis str. 3776 D15 iv]|uniref:Relaxase/mobilization nuclease domain protein n=1 Tax=Parabacteroides distasonis str. 3776 D15 i TaxID=1339342 RepID=A0AB34L4U4_PARDI|nr:relaxase/mobilization nuclease domain-containing protein [Parabacteroides distasonis]KDS35503.1 relaxase/mobilization nuclease domain protein [Parabacteroides distasonis str. 3776 D15 i]KDS42441.1 relaxase/mobilization nuclease domain protein [Parabacteroides distasonis str. 3776 Po2 i]KDS70696.1 relaxase/mobilization nuclease domain protein [Parabacteroides distasonis str. 3776 D15 iv]UVR25882.1 relaxase/mobilization nuclease domain-containing protein [Parabacteroides distasonis]